jgi:hypothetical protein
MHSLEFENGTARTLPVYLASRPKALAQVTTSKPDYGTSTGKASRTGKAIDKDNADFKAKRGKYSAKAMVQRLRLIGLA